MKVTQMKTSFHALNTSKELKSARKLLEFACDKTWHLSGLGFNLDPDAVQIEFNNKMTRAIGRAEFKYPCSYRIKLSAPLWPRASEADRRNTVIHEACHLIDYYQNKKMDHGDTWKQLMLACGESANRCHSVDRTGLIRKRKRHEFRCGCSSSKFIGPVKAKRIKQGSLYVCRSCKQNIVLTGKIVEV